MTIINENFRVATMRANEGIRVYNPNTGQLSHMIRIPEGSKFDPNAPLTEEQLKAIEAVSTKERRFQVRDSNGAVSYEIIVPGKKNVDISTIQISPDKETPEELRQQYLETLKTTSLQLRAPYPLKMPKPKITRINEFIAFGYTREEAVNLARQEIKVQTIIKANQQKKVKMVRAESISTAEPIAPLEPPSLESLLQFQEAYNRILSDSGFSTDQKKEIARKALSELGLLPEKLFSYQNQLSSESISLRTEIRNKLAERAQITEEERISQLDSVLMMDADSEINLNKLKVVIQQRIQESEIEIKNLSERLSQTVQKPPEQIQTGIKTYEEKIKGFQNRQSELENQLKQESDQQKKGYIKNEISGVKTQITLAKRHIAKLQSQLSFPEQSTTAQDYQRKITFQQKCIETYKEFNQKIREEHFENFPELQAYRDLKASIQCLERLPTMRTELLAIAGQVEQSNSSGSNSTQNPSKRAKHIVGDAGTLKDP